MNLIYTCEVYGLNAGVWGLVRLARRACGVYMRGVVNCLCSVTPACSRNCRVVAPVTVGGAADLAQFVCCLILSVCGVFFI